MNIKPTGLVVVPRRPLSIGSLLHWARDVTTAIKQLRDRSWSFDNGSPIRSRETYQFKVSLKKDGGTYKATVKPGWVRRFDPKSTASDPVKDTPFDGWDDDPPAEHTVALNQGVFCRVQTDIKGIVNSVTIAVEVATKKSTHYQPEPEKAGDQYAIAGDYYFLLAKIIADPVASGALKTEQHQHGGPIYFEPYLWTGKMIGTGDYDIYKYRKHADDEYQFRKIKQNTATNTKPIIKPISDPDNPPDQIEFRCIGEKSTNSQIKVKAGSTSDEIKIEGNSQEGKRGNQIGGGAIEWFDGLVTSTSAVEPIGELGNVCYHNGTNWINFPNPYGSGMHVLTITGSTLAWVETFECDSA